ncbi:MAG: MFS transporter [Planctomycetia bacterium]|nr:MFS transporter [Planctomycetia bacterium]
MSRAPLARQLLAALASQRRVMVAVLPGVALAMLNATALDLPRADIIDALDSDRYRIEWIAGAYILGGAVGMALTQFVGQRLGLRRTYVAALLFFAAAAGGCALASEVVWMTPLRLAQGFGMGLAISAGMVLVWQAFPAHKELAMALYGMAVYVPSVAGATVGGLLTAWLSWRLIFLINLPLGVAVASAAWRLLPEDRPGAAAAPARLDWFGLALLAAMIVTMSVVLDLGQYWGWLVSPFFVPWFLGWLASTAAFVLWGVFAAAPLVNLRPLAIGNFGLGLAIKIAYSINLYLLVGLAAGYMIDLRGYQWWQGALVILPALVAMLAAIVGGTAIGNDANRKTRMLVGLAVMAAATWQFTSLDVYTAKAWQAAVFACWGIGAGLVCGPALLTTFEGLSAAQSLQGAGVFNIARSLPSFAAAGLLATLLTRHADENFDWLRLNIRDNRPVVAQSLRDAAAHARGRGSPHDAATRQSHALVTQWVHANSRAYALEDVFSVLALVPCLAMPIVLLVRIPAAQSATMDDRSTVGSAFSGP